MIVLSIVAMVVDRRLDSFSVIRSNLSLPLAPLHYLVNAPTQLVDYFSVALSSRDDLIKENADLKLNQLLLQAQVQRVLALESENNYLKSLAATSKPIQSKTLIAELLAVSSSPFVNQVIINRGQRDHLYIGQTVIDAHGLMGQVISVGPITSRVLLINDPHSGVSVQNIRNGTRAMAVGDGYSGKLKLLYVPKTADINVDDLMVTSGLGDRYPAGYPVGKVISVEKKPSSQFAVIYLQPIAYLDRSRQVLLIWKGN